VSSRELLSPVMLSRDFLPAVLLLRFVHRAAASWSAQVVLKRLEQDSILRARREVTLVRSHHNP
jgi:hypothetical protein